MHTESVGGPGSYARNRHRPSAVAALVAVGLAAALPARASPPDAPLTGWMAKIGEAAQALSEDRPDASEAAAREALSALPRGVAAARARAALGLALARRGAPEEAAKALEDALGEPATPARFQLAAERAEMLLATGDARDAVAPLQVAATSDPLALAVRARLRLGETLVAAGRGAEAVPILEAELRAHPSDPGAPAARLALAAGRRAAGDAAGAVEAYRALWLEADLPESAAAGAALERWRAEGGPVPVPGVDDRLARAARLVATGRPEPALAELDLAAGGTGGDAAAAGRIAALRAMALVALGRHAEAGRLAGPLAADADPGVRRSALLTLGRIAARAGRVDEATRLYADVSREPAPVPGLPEWRQRDLADEAAYLSAWLRYDAGQLAEAALALDRFVRQNPRSRRVDEARWFAAWARYLLGRRAEAARGFARLARGPLADAATYWQGRLAAPARRRALYLTAAAGGDAWYALLARARLAALGTPAPPPPVPAPRPLPELAPPVAAARFAAASELLGLGLTSAALEELRAIARSPDARPAAALIAQLAAFAGDAELPFRMARDHLGATRRALRWAHPEPYPELVQARADAVGVDPALVLAVMRRESSFRPAVRSGAGAEGLLQLRPATAERLATVLGLPPGLGARLAEPAVSVSLGAHYLGLLASRFQDAAPAVAAYNAGPGPVQGWARARARLPLDAWVECIPFRETRQYVKIVLADWDLYRRLEGRLPAPIDPEAHVRAPLDGIAF